MTGNWLFAQTGRREIASVVVLWLVLLCASLLALFVFSRSSINLINHIQYVKAGRSVRTQALYEEARKRAELALAKAAAAPGHRIAPQDPDYRAAVNLYHKAFQLDPRGELAPEQAVHYEILLRIHEAAGQNSAALAAGVYQALARGDLAGAGTLKDRLIALAPDEPETWHAAVEVALRSGKLNEARSALATLIKRTPKPEARGMVLQARVARAEGNQEEAIAGFKRALELDPSLIDVRKHLAQLLSSKGRQAEAANLLLQGESLGGSRDGNYMHMLGDALFKTGRLEEAVRAFTVANTLEPHSADVQWALARALHTTGRLRQAQRAMQRACELNPELCQKALGDGSSG